MNAITNMDLENPDFIDVKAFDQSKAILVNALDELEMYIGYFNKGDYDKFPKPAWCCIYLYTQLTLITSHPYFPHYLCMHFYFF